MDLDHATIYAAWERYVAGPEPVPDAIEGVRPEIVASWRRSKGKADPFATEPPTLSKQAFEIVLDENKLLCQLAFPYLLEFYRSLRETGHSIMLSDKRGFQLLLLSEDQEFLELSQQAQMNNGCDFSEASVGTNGIGTSLAMAGPVMVWGPEHFLKVYHPLVCYAAPIYDMAHSIVGSINITGPVEVYQPYIMGMLAIATNGIENEFKLTQTNTMLKTVLDSYENGTLLLGADKTILYYNAQVPPLLRLKDEELLGRPISSVVQLSSLPAELQSFDRPVDRVECTLLNKLQEPIDVSLSIRPARHDAHDLDSTIVILRTQKAVHHMANRIAGFQASYTFDSIVACHEQLLANGLTTDTPPDELATADEVSYTKKGSPIYIELHRHLFDSSEDAHDELGRFFADIRPVESDGFLAMPPHEHLLYLILHAYKHFVRSGIGLRQFCDVGLWARAYHDQIDWPRLHDQCASVHAATFAAAAFQIARAYLGIAFVLPAPWRDDIDAVPLLHDTLCGGVYGSNDYTRLHSSTVTLNAVKASRAGERGGVLRTVFPKRAHLARRYPYLKKKPYLLPVAWAQRIAHYASEKRASTDDSASGSLRLAKERIELMKRYGIIERRRSP